MAGIFAALWGLMYAGSSIGAALDNAECKQRKHWLGNGIAYYYDRKGQTRLYDGTPIHLWADGTVVNCKTLEVIYDKKKEEAKRAAKKVEGQKYRYIVKYDERCTNMATVDLNSNKVVARIEAYIDKKGKVVYRKWFLNELKDSFGYIKNLPDSVVPGDIGVVITREEFDAIRHAPCSDTRIYRNYTDCYVCKEHEILSLNGEDGTDFIANRIEWAKENWTYDTWYNFRSQWLPWRYEYEEPDVIPEKATD